jgi:hypothetical protein
MQRKKAEIKTLAKFLVKAKLSTYASGKARKLKPQRPGFEEFQFSQKEWSYRDSYAGHYAATGQEVVRFKNRPVWSMSYSGGMAKEFHGSAEFTEQTFKFLREALSQVTEAKPFRGPEHFIRGEFGYINHAYGSMASFNGIEVITHKGREVFRQYYIGGLVVGK